MTTATTETEGLRIWVDADACPKVIKEILFRAAQRLEVRLILVANHALVTPPTPLIIALQVSSGFDVADDLIVEQAATGDIAITGEEQRLCVALGRRLAGVSARLGQGGI